MGSPERQESFSAPAEGEVKRAALDANSSIVSNTTDVLESGLQDAMQALGMFTSSSLGRGLPHQASSKNDTEGQIVLGHKTKDGIVVITERDLLDYELLVPDDPNSLSNLGGHDVGGGPGHGVQLSSKASPIHIRRLNGARYRHAGRDLGTGADGSQGSPGAVDWDRASLRALLRHSDEKSRERLASKTRRQKDSVVGATMGAMQKRRIWRGRPNKK